MYRLVKRKTLHVWIAVMAILFSALAPSISHAVARSSSLANLIEICTVGGTRLVAADGSEAKQASTAALMHTFEHCAYCMSHDGAFALLPQLPATFAVIGGHDLYPSLFYNAPRALFSWTAANPRGPPAAA